MEPTRWLIQFAVWSFATFGLVLFVLQIGLRELGYWIGHRKRIRSEAMPENVGVIVGSMLGLLGFVLALTLNFASSRYADRQNGTLAEANAIGTAWLRAEAIGHPRGKEIARLMEDYTRIRIDYVRATASGEALGSASRRTGAIQTLIWGHMAAIAQERQDPLVGLLQNALNEAFDMSTAERFAFEKQLPPTLIWLLIGMALLSMAALGYQLGLRGTPLRLMGTMLTAMWTLVMIVILDLASPRIGGIRTEATAYEWTLKGFEGGIPIPPFPAR
ncbi:MAG: hypothetical protein O9972_06985 [Burkholderiales bacterium]|nr:hypothetical protein [Burkholderiales bacterium]